MKLSIIIVTFRGWNRLRACLTSLGSLNQSPFRWEVIVVDNQSGDGEMKRLGEEFPSVTFVENTGNYGYAHACNEGSRRASGEFLFFLNPDTLVNREAIEAMLRAAEDNPEIYLFSCTQFNEKGKRMRPFGHFMKLSTMSGLLRTLNRMVNPHMRTALVKSGHDAIFPDWISGSAVMVSGDHFWGLTGWCEDYWMYYEDMDLCKRVADAGGVVAIITEVAITHIHGGSSRINAGIKAVTKSEVHVSRHVYIQKHFRGIRRALMHGYFVVNNLLLEHLLLAVGGLLFFFSLQARVYLRLYSSLIAYYYGAAADRTWTSRRSFSRLSDP